ncbi:MAG: amidohydrolase [Ectothiorhodospiraceae bacterium]|nr:amidohydrolase [Ectothiorhodospiraceae bacterium]
MYVYEQPSVAIMLTQLTYSGLVLAICCCCLTSCDMKERVDLVVLNASIQTMDEDFSTAEAMAIRDGKIIATGSDEQMQEAYDADSVVDMDGRYVFPGLTDAHAHLLGLGQKEQRLDLVGTTSKEEILQLVAEKAATVGEGEWIVGRGWDQNDWPVKEFPIKADLDAVAPDNPVYLTRIDGHAAWVNSFALDVAGVDENTADPAGGRILKQDGKLQGILIDAAETLVYKHIPEPTHEQLRAAYTLAVERCLELGITGVHDMGLYGTHIDAIRSLIEEDEFPFRMVGYVGDDEGEWKALLASGPISYGNDHLMLCGRKVYLDGALGSRGAMLLAPYSDDPGNYGVQINSGEVLEDITRDALSHGLQVCVHAIGDSANRMAVDAFEKALNGGQFEDHRLRVEHAQVVTLADIPRFAALGILPSMQTTHCTSDMYWAEARLGHDRIHRGYAWRSFRNAGCIVPIGSDFPVEHANPLLGIYAACTRQDREGRPAKQEHIDEHFQIDGPPEDPARYRNGWYGDERLTRKEALQGFTVWAAHAAKQEKRFGSLEAGKYADFIVVDRDLLNCSNEELLKVQVLETFVAGSRQYTLNTAD